MLKARILTALLLLPVFLAALFYLPNPYWALLMLGMVLAGAHEWANIAGFSAPRGWIYVLLTLLAGLLLLPEANRPGILGYGIAFAFWLILVPLWLFRQWRGQNPVLLGLTGWVVLLPTWLALVELRDLGAGLLLGLMAVVWIADTAAYFAGRRFGKHKLAPAISPGKTWEGVAGAFVGVTLYGAVWAMSDSSAAPFRSGMPFGLLLLWVLTMFSILGDLFESWAKRVGGVKDSGKLLPGHGGVLDRIDALTAVLPLAAFWLAFRNSFLT